MVLSNESFSFELVTAEIICRKDNAEILSLTINTLLSSALRCLSTQYLVFDEDDDVNCFLSFPVDGKVCIKPHLYVVGDLAFYGMVLGKEGMSGKHCHLCKMLHKDFPNLAENKELWDFEEMEKVAEDFLSCRKVTKKPVYGIKNLPWWTSIPLSNYVVPLLH